MVVRVGGRLVHEHAAGEVDRQRDLGTPGGFGHGVNDFRLGRVHAGGQRAVGGDDALGEGDGRSGVGNLDDEADRAEALFHVLGLFAGVTGKQHRRADFSLREVRVVELVRREDDGAELAGGSLVDALEGVGRLDGAEHGVGDFRLGEEAGDRLGQIGTDLVVGLVAVFGFNPAGRHEDGLRGGAHLA